MAINFIPKIVYGDTPTEIAFRYPPEEDDGDREKGVLKSTKSKSGVEQVSLDYIEATRKIRYKLLNESEITALRTFYRTHAVLGKSFKYYEHKTEAGFVEYTLGKHEFDPKRLTWKNGGWLYSIEFTFRRVVA